MLVNSLAADDEESSEVEAMRREMNLLNQVNEEQRKTLENQRSVLMKRNEDATDLDRTIEALTARLRESKLSNAAAVSAGAPGGFQRKSNATTQGNTGIVEPLMKQQQLKEGKVRERVEISVYFFALYI